MRVKEMKALSPTELHKALEEARQNLFNLRFRLATRQLDNYREIPRVKREIAQLRTTLREKELGIR